MPYLKKIRVALSVCSVIGITFLLTIPQVSFAEKSIDEYWATTGLRFAELQTFLTEDNCYYSESTFVGCIEALNVLAAQLEPSAALIPRELRLKNPTVFGKTVHRFGMLDLVELDTAITSQVKGLSIAKKYRKLKEFRDRIADGWNYVYSLRQIARLPFSDLTKSLINLTGNPTAVNEAMLTGVAINEFIGAAEDPHTTIRPRQYQENSRASKQESWYGIGVYIKEADGKLKVEHLSEDGSAAASGIRPNDSLVSIDDEPVNRLSAEDVVKKIRGKEATTVKIKIRRNNKVLTFVVPRAPQVVQNVTSKRIKDAQQQFAYYKIDNFVEDQTCSQLARAVVEVESSGAVDGTILDLRDNLGGQLAMAQCVSNMFLPPGKTVVTIRSLQNPAEEGEVATDRTPLITSPTVVLINGSSASASEIVAGALQDYQRAILVGTRSYGKGSVQFVSPISKHSSLTTDAEQYRELLGVYINAKGFAEDRELITDVTANELLRKLENEERDEQAIPEEYRMSPTQRLLRTLRKNPEISLARTEARFYLPSNRTNQVVGVEPDIEVLPLPGLTHEDYFEHREADIYANALIAQNPPWQNPRPKEVGTLEDCVKKLGRADRSYRQLVERGIEADYQRLKAQDTLSCMILSGIK